jgi:penicillin-binding protein 1A
VNTVAVRVLQELGVDRSYAFLENDLHLTGLVSSKTLPNGSVVTDRCEAALALGQLSYGLTVRQITQAYTVLATDGVLTAGRSYYRVLDGQGRVLLEKPYLGEAVLSEGTAALMTTMLRDVVTVGSGKAVTLDEKLGVDCAGKTGTTGSNCDRWFVGYTPYLLAGVWYGHEYPAALTGLKDNPCITVWDDVMTALHRAYADDPAEARRFSSGEKLVEVACCADSGKLPTAACLADPRGNRTVTGYFLPGSEPTDSCDRHVLVRYDREGGGVVIGDCPGYDCIRVGLIRVTRRFPVWVAVADAQYVWQPLAADALPDLNAGHAFFESALGPGEYCGSSGVERPYNRCCSKHFSVAAWLERRRGR